MKKVIHYCLIIFFILIFVPGRKVYADWEYCDVGNSSSVNYKISYDITKFTMNEQKIHFEGWSFLDHMDNYGGINKSTYIAAYVGNWNDSWNKLENCKNSSSCYYVHAQEDDWSMYDLYFIRCTGNACSDKTRKETLRDLENNRKKFEDASCTGSTAYNYGGSHCAYHNIGFQLDMNISDVVKKLGNKKTIKFRLITKVRSREYRKNIKNNNNNIRTDSIDIGVFPGTTCTIFNKNCSTGKGTYQSKDSQKKVTLGGLSQNALFTAVNAQGSGNENYSSIRSKCFYPSGIYKIKSVYGTRNRSNWKGDRTGTFFGRLAYIELVGNKPQGNDVGFSWTAWFRAAKSLKLKLEVTPPPPDESSTCEKNEYCVGSNCKYDETKCPIHSSKLKKVTCTKKQEKKTCDSVEYGETQCDTTVTNSNYYYRISAKEFNEKFGASLSSSEKEVKRVGDFYYFPVKFSANVSYFQNAELTVGGSSDNDRFKNGKVVTSGLNFSYSYKYTVSSRWNYKDGYKLNTSNNNTFVFSKMYITSEKKRKEVQILVFLGEGDQLYTRDKKGVFHLSYKYNLDSLKIIISNSAKRNALDSVDKDKKNKVTFDNSNDASSKTKNSSAGSFSCSSPSLSKSEWGAGKVRSSTCTYWIKKAFFSNRMNGNIIYRNSNSVSGYYVDPNNKDGSKSWYYIPANLKTGDSFTFKVSNPNLSLINKITFTYNATCSVKGKNEIHDSSKIKYRSIDTSNPFPKVENKINYSAYPKNWQQYVKDKGLNRIVSNSFNGISYQTNFFKNKTYIDSLKSMYGDYYSYNDMDTSGNGTSAIIHKENLFSKINGYHNKAGEYKEEKDKVQS